MDIDAILKIMQLIIREGGQLASLAQRLLSGDMTITDAEIDAAAAERKAAVASWDAVQAADK